MHRPHPPLWKRSSSSAFPAKAGIQSPHKQSARSAQLDPRLRGGHGGESAKCRIERSGFRGWPKIIPSDLNALTSPRCRTEPPRTYGAAGWGIIPPMTRHKHAHTGLVTPQLPQHWLTAALRMFAMLVLNVASTLQMICRRTRVNATRAAPAALPKAKTDTQSKETPSAVQPDSLQSAHPEQARYAGRPSKDERVLTEASYALAQHREPPINASPSLRSSRRKSGSRAPWAMLATGLRQQPWVPAFAGMSGELITATNKNAAA